MTRIRIIGGQWRGYKIPVSISNSLRPTSDRIRETLFNWLRDKIYGANCLDCFAGSGVLSIEAISRHASRATMIEIKRSTVKIIRKCCITLGVQFVTRVINDNILCWLAKPGNDIFDVVFVDPPFYKNLLNKTIFLLENSGRLASKSMIYIEYESTYKLYIPTNWILYREIKTKRVTYQLYFKSRTI